MTNLNHVHIEQNLLSKHECEQLINFYKTQQSGRPTKIDSGEQIQLLTEEEKMFSFIEKAKFVPIMNFVSSFFFILFLTNLCRQLLGSKRHYRKIFAATTCDLIQILKLQVFLFSLF